MAQYSLQQQIHHAHSRVSTQLQTHTSGAWLRREKLRRARLKWRSEETKTSFTSCVLKKQSMAWTLIEDSQWEEVLWVVWVRQATSSASHYTKEIASNVMVRWEEPDMSMRKMSLACTPHIVLGIRCMVTIEQAIVVWICDGYLKELHISISNIV